MNGIYNVLTLVLAIAALGIPFFYFGKVKKNPMLLMGLSLMSCAASICFQVVSINHLVNIRDFGAIEDIMFAVAGGSVTLLVATIAINSFFII